MRLAAYVSKSRHGIFYLRWPIPASLHPTKKHSDLKLSLGTRSPCAAQRLSRLFTVAGQSILMTSSVGSMKYDEIREHVRDHFQVLLKQFKDDLSETGQALEPRLDALRAAQGLSDGDAEAWARMDARWLCSPREGPLCASRAIRGNAHR